jgi:Domain of unknown function (DUF1992)
MSLPLDQLVEDRIRRAQQEGAFDDLPGAGAPLQLDDDALVPAELRMVCRVLKNAGYVPPEVEHLRELRQLEALALSEAEAGARGAARRRMELLLAQLEQSGLGRVAHRAWADYADKVAARLAREK